jgi:peroxiredoxin 2/4
MKKKNLLLILSFVFTGYIWSQENKDIRIPLIGEAAPAFTAESTKGHINFPDDYFGKWKILFSHPAAFTAVCSTEIIELAALQEDMEKLNTKLLVISTDGINSHLEWVKSLESIKYHGKDPVKIKFPLISDYNLDISRKYGMLHSFTSSTKDIRGVFVIDPEDRIRAIIYYPMTVGRNMDEIKRLVMALQQSEKDHVLTPANWQPGQDVLLPSPKTSEEAEKMSGKKDPDLTEITWYLWFKKMR